MNFLNPKSTVVTWQSRFVMSLLMVFTCLVFVFSCKKNKTEKAAQPAFYFWKTNLQVTDNEQHIIDSVGVKKLYVKFFDVDWDEGSQQAVPLAEVQVDTTNLQGLEIVPTVFITNRTFKSLPEAGIGKLAENVWEKISQLSKTFGHQQAILEVQLDCDWSGSTREKYFLFLKILQEKKAQISTQNSPVKVSCTIRLHQLKYPDRTGIPPVDRGMLMLYNMGEVDEWETENSILDLEILDQYLPAKKYPLPLDIALPIFRWGVVFRAGIANDEEWILAHLINNLSAEDLADTTRFAALAPHRFEVRKSTYLEGYYLYEGDRVRLEDVTPDLLENMVSKPATFLKSDKLERPQTVVFYHLDTSNLKVFNHEKLESILGNF